MKNVCTVTCKFLFNNKGEKKLLKLLANVHVYVQCTYSIVSQQAHACEHDANMPSDTPKVGVRLHQNLCVYSETSAMALVSLTNGTNGFLTAILVHQQQCPGSSLMIRALLRFHVPTNDYGSVSRLVFNDS